MLVHDDNVHCPAAKGREADYKGDLKIIGAFIPLFVDFRANAKKYNEGPLGAVVRNVDRLGYDNSHERKQQRPSLRHAKSKMCKVVTWMQLALLSISIG